MSSGLLLDTCAIIWLANREPFSEIAKAAVEQARRDACLFVSPFSAWEIGTLIRRGRFNLSGELLAWFQEFIARSGAGLLPLTPGVLIASTALPDSIHNDPADRIIIATARSRALSIVTRDRLILDYAQQGHVNALPC